jgi:type II secretory pathway component PulF
MDFEYVAIDQQGTRHKGSTHAIDLASANRQLVAQGLHPLELTELASTKSWRDKLTSQVSLDELEFFTSQLALLLESGVRVDQGIDIIYQSTTHPGLSKVLTKISSCLNKGMSLSESFAEHQALFGPLYVSLLKIGETSGNLPEVLQRLSADLKFQKELKAQISQALTYPSVIMVVCLAAVYFVNFYCA